MRRTQTKRCGELGFTLIEVLVVVAIIALLISILLPALAQARAQTRFTLCLSNLHQLCLAMQAYSDQFKGKIPRGADVGEPNWIQEYSLTLGSRNRYPDPNQVPVDKLPIFHCPERMQTLDQPFVDYLVNAMNPKGPAGGSWASADQMRSSPLALYKYPADVLYLCDAEREDKNIGADSISLSDAHRNWASGNWGKGAMDMLDAWKGEHLPEGKGTINTSDAKGPRRVARKMHLQRLTNAGFLDGHADGLPLSRRDLSDEDKYARWLRLFGVGVTDAQAAKTQGLK